MPFSKRQVRRILDEDNRPIIALGRSDNLALRVTESYLRRKLYAWEDRAVGQQWDQFDEAFNDIRAYGLTLADQMNVDSGERTPVALAWRRGTMAYARQTLQRTMNATAYEGLRSALTAYYAGYYGGAWQLHMLAGREVNIPRPAQFDAHMAVLMPRLQESVLPDNMLYDLLGEDFRQAHADELAEMLVKINRAFDTGLNNGEGFSTIFRRVRDEMGIETDRRKGFTANFHRVQTLTRTAIMTSSNAGNLAVYEQNADVVTHTEWLAAHDGRVCRLCASLDGTRWPLGDSGARVPPGDSHPNCRCTIIPVVSLNIGNESPPPMTWKEWLLIFGGGLILDDFLDSELASTQI